MPDWLEVLYLKLWPKWRFVHRQQRLDDKAVSNQRLSMKKLWTCCRYLDNWVAAVWLVCWLALSELLGWSVMLDSKNPGCRSVVAFGAVSTTTIHETKISVCLYRRFISKTSKLGTLQLLLVLAVIVQFRLSTWHHWIKHAIEECADVASWLLSTSFESTRLLRLRCSLGMSWFSLKIGDL